MRSWRKYTTGDYYVENLLGTTSSQNEKIKNRIERVAFWNQLLPKLANLKIYLSNNIPREFQNSPGNFFLSYNYMIIYKVIDPAAGFRNAMYTLVALVIALLALLLICIILLKKRYRERESHLHMGY